MGLAYCHLAACNEPLALDNFEAAFATAPEHPGTMASMALAHILRGNKTAAFDLARSALLADPACEQAAVVLPQAAPADFSLAELEALVPGRFLDVPAVLRGLAQAASGRGERDAEVCHAERAHLLAPGDWRSGAQLGGKLLAPVADDDDSLGLTRMVPPSLRGRLGRATDLLRDAWDRIRDTGNARRAPEVASNLCAALLLDGNDRLARTVLDEGLAAAPQDVALLLRSGWFAAMDCDWAAALSAFERVPEDGLELDDRFVVAKALLEAGRTAEARAAIADLVTREASRPGTRERSAALELEMEIASGGGEDIVAAALDSDPDSMLLRAAALPVWAGNAGLHERLSADCRRIGAVAPDPRDRALAADTLARLGHPSDAADIFASVPVPTHVDTPVLRGRLRALLVADRRTDARELLDTLDPALRPTQPYLEAAVYLYDRIGDLPAAIRTLEAAFRAGHEETWSRLAWLDATERSGGVETAKAWLATVGEDMPGTPAELMALAQAMDKLIGDPKALAIGYRALRAGYYDPKIHMAYAFGLYMLGNAVKRLPPQPTAVAGDTAVTLSYEGRPDIVRVIECGEAPSLTRGENSPTDPLALRLIGLRPGDEIDLPVLGGTPRRYRVAMIEDRFRHANRRTLHDFHRLFPENTSFQTLPLDIYKGADALAPIIDIASRHSERVGSLLETYREGRLPLAFFAHAAGKHACDVWDAMRERRDLPLVCALGTAPERNEAADCLASSSVPVLDPLSVYAVVAVGIHDEVAAALSGRAVTQSTIDYLRTLVDQRRQAVDCGTGTLGWNGQSLVMDEPGREQRETLLTTAEGALAFALGCRVVAAEGTAPLPEAAGVLAAMPDAFADTIRAAMAPGHLLISDDLCFRQVAAACGVQSAAWTQPVHQHGLEQGRYAFPAFATANAALAATSYRFLSFGEGEIINVLRSSGWTREGQAERLLQRLADAGNEAAGVAGIVAGVLLAATVDGRLARACSSLLDAFLDVNASGTSAIMMIALAIAGARLRNQCWSAVSERWAETAGLTPADAVMARILEPAVRHHVRITVALREAFRAAGVEWRR